MHLRFTDDVVDEMRRRDISIAHVHEVSANGPVLDRRVLIGPDDSGRILAISVEPAGEATLRVTDARPAERAEIVTFRTSRRRPSFSEQPPAFVFEVALDEETWVLARSAAAREGITTEEVVRRAIRAQASPER